MDFAWAHGRALLIGVVCIVSGPGLSERVKGSLYKKSGLLGISGISNDMRDLLEKRTGRQVAVDYLFTDLPKRSVRSSQCWAALMDWCLPPASERTRRKFAGASANLPPGSDWNSTRKLTLIEVRAFLLRKVRSRRGSSLPTRKS